MEIQENNYKYIEPVNPQSKVRQHIENSNSVVKVIKKRETIKLKNAKYEYIFKILALYIYIQ